MQTARRHRHRRFAIGCANNVARIPAPRWPPCANTTANRKQTLLHAQESDLLDDSPEPTQAHTPPRELKALTRARRGQQQQRKRQRIDLALTQTPSDAGPLNSHRLVTSAIRTLQTLSPAYLEHFVNYVETLMVLEKAGKKRS